VTKIPILGDIPILGYLFKSTSTARRKTNLLVMLTPYIAKDQGDLQVIRRRKQREHDEFVRSFASLDGMSYQPTLDYGRKRGVIEEINRAVQSVDSDAVARAGLVRSPGVTPGVIELPASP